MSTNDYMIRATAADAQIRAFAITTRNLVEEVRKIQDSQPVATAAIGRLMSGALMMGDMLKGDDDKLTVKIDGDGPLQGLVATVDSHGHVKGRVKNPYVELPLKPNGHLNVGGAVGKGTLTVIRDMGLKDPYVGSVELYSGEIAEDLTLYYSESEQIPSSVGLGVLVDTDLSVKVAGGFFIQLMPFCSDAVIDKLEQNIKNFTAVTDVLNAGKTPEDLLNMILAGLDVKITDKKPVSFECGCDRDRVRRTIALLGKEEVDDMISENKDVELKCQFCGKAYTFSVNELKDIRKEMK